MSYDKNFVTINFVKMTNERGIPNGRTSLFFCITIATAY